MELQYLVDSAENMNHSLAIAKKAGISYKKSCLDKEHFIVTFSIKANDRKAAFRLSDLNNMLVDKINLTVLVNGSAAYFNKNLFPLINDFERKLRKLLYIASALKPAGQKNISGLEQKDFGEIFDSLFHDKDFSAKVRAYINVGKKGTSGDENTWSGYSSELASFLAGIKEKPLWDSLLPNQVPTLRERFIEIRLRRNDVMHAHNINKKIFTDTEKLFKQVNKELDQAIEEISRSKTIPESFNQSLANIIFIEANTTETISAEITE